MCLCVRKINLVKGQNVVVTSSNLDEVLRKDLPEQVALEQRLE